MQWFRFVFCCGIRLLPKFTHFHGMQWLIQTLKLGLGRSQPYFNSTVTATRGRPSNIWADFLFKSWWSTQNLNRPSMVQRKKKMGLENILVWQTGDKSYGYQSSRPKKQSKEENLWMFIPVAVAWHVNSTAESPNQLHKSSKNRNVWM